MWRGKRRVLGDEEEEDNEEDGAERRGKARQREAAVVTLEAIAMGMVRRCRSEASALRRRRVVGAVRQACGAAAGRRGERTEQRQEQWRGRRCGRWIVDELTRY